jgi:serine/threonine protein phosphatase PrpC
MQDMKFTDPIAVEMRKINDLVVIAGSRLIGEDQTQRDYFSIFRDECVVVADGVCDTVHGDVASKLAGETALWGYKLIRQRPFYWADRRLLLRRIFRSSNLTIWQKHREKGFETNFTTTLAVVIVGGQKFWVGTAGDTRVLLYRESLIDILTPTDVDQNGVLTRALGFKRLGLVPHVVVEKMLPRDTILIATAGVIDFLDEEQLRVTFEATGDTEESIMNVVTHLLSTAQENGSNGSLTACVIKRIHREG